MKKKNGVTGGKRREVEELMLALFFGDPEHWGPYTKVLAVYKGKVAGYGLARRNEEDPERSETGITIAKYRAARSVLYKLKGKHPHHPLMG